MAEKEGNPYPPAVSPGSKLKFATYLWIRAPRLHATTTTTTTDAGVVECIFLHVAGGKH